MVETIKYKIKYKTKHTHFSEKYTKPLNMGICDSLKLRAAFSCW